MKHNFTAFADFQFYCSQMGSENQICEYGKQIAGESSWTDID